MCISIFHATYSGPFLNIRNFLFFGFPFVLTGRLLREYDIPRRLQSHSDALLWGIWFACLALSFSEALIHLFYVHSGRGGYREDYFFTLPMCISMLLLALRMPASRWSKWPARIGRKHSAAIYILHPIVMKECARFGWSQSPDRLRAWLQPLLVFALTLLLSVASVALQRGLDILKRHMRKRKGGCGMPA